MAVAIQGRHVVLLRGHVYEVGISLPREGSWSLSAGADWTAVTPAAIDAVLPAIAAAVERERASEPPPVTLADVALALEASFGRLSRPPARVGFPGTPVPSEASIDRKDAHVGIFQGKGGVRVVVSPEMTVVDASAGLATLPAWVAGALVKQAKEQADAKAREEARRRMPPPKLEDVLAAMRAGKRFRTGAGRWYHSYFMRDGVLVAEEFDEGHVSEAPTTEEFVGEEIAKYGVDFVED